MKHEDFKHFQAVAVCVEEFINIIIFWMEVQ